jgi:hypothetical protein
MKNLIFTILFVLVSLISFAQTLQTNIIVLREDSIENQLDGTFQYTITQVEDTFKVASNLDPHEYVIFKFVQDMWGDHDLGDGTKLVTSHIKHCAISDGNTDSYLKKIFELSKVDNTKIGLLVKPGKRKFKYVKEFYDGVEVTVIEETVEGVTEYMGFSIFNRKSEVAFKEF